MPIALRLEGKSFGWLTVLEDIGVSQQGKRLWRCRCECGNVVEVESTRLVHRNKTSCGCKTKELQRAKAVLRITHGCARTGNPSPEYTAWTAMKARCYNSSTTGYQRYGGRGIKVCARWIVSFQSFLNDMGSRPGPEYSLERRDNDGDYTKKNCCWATKPDQLQNRSSTIRITIAGVTKLRAEWLKEIGIRSAAFRHRLRMGMTVEQALKLPRRQGARSTANV